jgi:hypothetical protein
MSFYKVSWRQLAQDSLAAVSQIKGKKIDKIISISRGGLVVSRIVSDILDCQISHIVISSYIGHEKQGKPYICELPGVSFMNQHILIVDEVSDSGDTLQEAYQFVSCLSPKKIYTLAPYVKPHTSYKPDFFSQETSDWIIFPYDIRETYQAFTEKFGSREKALKKMREVGFEDWEVEVVTDVGM